MKLKKNKHHWLGILASPESPAQSESPNTHTSPQSPISTFNLLGHLFSDQINKILIKFLKILKIWLKKMDFWTKTDNRAVPPKSITTFIGKSPHFLNPQSLKLAHFGPLIMDIIYKIIKQISFLNFFLKLWKLFYLYPFPRT